MFVDKPEDGVDYFNVNGYAVPYQNLPCSKCDIRYNPVCPVCDWNGDAKYNTYAKMTIEEVLNARGIVRVKRDNSLRKKSA